jgi:hypothetical protein
MSAPFRGCRGSSPQRTSASRGSTESGICAAQALSRLGFVPAHDPLSCLPGRRTESLS